jgi:GTPase SAR1 family protein
MVPPSSEGEKTFLFVGEKGSGKSSLIAKFLGDPVKEDMPETIALDFKFGKKQ